VESTPKETDNKSSEPEEKTETGQWYSRFIKGELSLAWTFWYHGILTIFFLRVIELVSYTLDQSGNLASLIAVFTVAYLCTLLVAVWRAGQKYKGSRIWTVLAILVVIVALLNSSVATLAYLRPDAT
jgi:hypothetical protein